MVTGKSKMGRWTKCRRSHTCDGVGRNNWWKYHRPIFLWCECFVRYISGNADRLFASWASWTWFWLITDLLNARRRSMELQHTSLVLFVNVFQTTFCVGSAVAKVRICLGHLDLLISTCWIFICGVCCSTEWIKLKSIDAVKEKVVEEIGLITPETLQRVHQNLFKRLRICIQQNGGLFEHLLWFAFAIFYNFLFWFSMGFREI